MSLEAAPQEPGFGVPFLGRRLRLITRRLDRLGLSLGL
jgi:hypothetical protein